MQYSTVIGDLTQQSSACLIVPVFKDNQLSAVTQLNKILPKGDIEGELGQSLMLYQVPHLAAERVLFIGCGDSAGFNEIIFRKALIKAAKSIYETNIKDAICAFSLLEVDHRDSDWKAKEIITIFEAQRYSFASFKTQKPAKEPALQTLYIPVSNKQQSDLTERGILEGQAIASGMKWVKDLANMPSNICTPTYLAEQAQALAAKYSSIKTTILETEDMRKKGMGALLSVAKGSHQPPKLIVLEHRGSGTNKKPVVLVGKGVTFDSGGISLKGPQGMDEMKYDMCGAATVMGVFKAIAELKLPINLMGIIPATENMPGGGASKPGDVVTTMSGQTIEILNTDAEGRLILSDALFYATTFDPALIIDIATLTGAIIITLGPIASGLMSNNEALSQDILQASKASGDRVWPLPIWSEYQEMVDSKIADVANIADSAKSIAAACLLARFVKNYPWAHLDIAGIAWQSGKEKGATGRPIPLLIQYLLNYVNNKPVYDPC